MSTYQIVEIVEYLLTYTDVAYSRHEIDEFWDNDLHDYLAFICTNPRINLESNLNIENEIVSIKKDRSCSRRTCFDVEWRIRCTSKAHLLIDSPSMEQAELAATSWLGQTVAIVPKDANLTLRFNPDHLKLNFQLYYVEQLPSQPDLFKLKDQELMCPLLCPLCSHQTRCNCDFHNQMEKSREYIEKSYRLNHAEAFFAFHSPAGTLHSRLGSIVKHL